jgi:hypothetical protein
MNAALQKGEKSEITKNEISNNETNDEIRMTNDETQRKMGQYRRFAAHLFRHSNFVIRHSSFVSLFEVSLFVIVPQRPVSSTPLCWPRSSSSPSGFA